MSMYWGLADYRLDESLTNTSQPRCLADQQSNGSLPEHAPGHPTNPRRARDPAAHLALVLRR